VCTLSLDVCVCAVKIGSTVQKSHLASFEWVRETIITNECFWYFYFFWDKMFTKRLLMSPNTPINLKIIRFRSIYRRGKFYFAHLVVSWLNHGFGQEQLFHPLYAHIHAKVSIQSWYCIQDLFLFLFFLEARAVGAKNRILHMKPCSRPFVWFFPGCRMIPPAYSCISCPRQMWPRLDRRTAEIGFLMPPIRNAWKVHASDERRVATAFTS